MYSDNDYRSYALYHHGIRGQKWGVRRYQNYDGTLTSAGRKHVYGSSKPGIVNRTKDRFGGVKKDITTTIQRTRDAKGVWNKGSELLGQGRAKTHQEVRQETQQKLSEHSRTKLGKRYHDQQAQNAGYSKNYHAKKQAKYDINKNKKLQVAGRMFMDSLVDMDYWKTPYQRLSGRESSRGKEFLDLYFTSGGYGIAKDIGYLVNKKKK
jgi:hypothetical protein